MAKPSNTKKTSTAEIKQTAKPSALKDQVPTWVVNVAKYIRAKDALKGATEKELKAEYIKYGGLIRDGGDEEEVEDEVTE